MLCFNFTLSRHAPKWKKQKIRKPSPNKNHQNKLCQIVDPCYFCQRYVLTLFKTDASFLNSINQFQPGETQMEKKKKKCTYKDTIDRMRIIIWRSDPGRTHNTVS